jgi:hypothetical protein
MVTNIFTTRVVVLLAFVAVLVLLSSCNPQIVPSWPDGQNVLQDGSFEDGTGPGGVFKPNNGGWMQVLPDGKTIPNWTVTGNPAQGGNPAQDVAWVQNNPGPFPNATTDGSHFLDLTGQNDTADSNGQFGGVVQTDIPTVVGFNYHLSFAIGIYNTAYPGPITVVAVLSGPNGENPVKVPCGLSNQQQPGQGPQWRTCESTGSADSPYFKAVSTTATLRIYGTGQKGVTHYIGLDRVLVDCVAPFGRDFFCSNRILGQ